MLFMDTTTINNKKKHILRYIIVFAIIVGLGALSLYISIGNEVSAVANALLSVRPQYLIIAMILMLCYYIIDAAIIKVVACEYKPDYTLRQGFVNNMTGILFSDLTPSATGGQFAQIYVFRNQGIPGATGSGMLVMTFISYQIIIVVYAAICMILQADLIFSSGPATRIIAIVGFAVNIGITGALFIFSGSKRMQNFLIDKIILGLHKIRIVKDYDKTVEKLRTIFHDYRKESRNLLANKKLFLTELFLNATKLTLLYSVPFFAFLAVGAHLEFSQFFGFLALASCITMFNTFMPIPGASGGAEGSYMLLFGFVGRSLASSSMLIWRLITFYMGLIIGIIVVLVSKEAKGFSGQSEESIQPLSN